MSDFTLTFQIWDRDLFKPNEFIADASINWTEYAQTAYKNDSKVDIQLENSKLDKLKNLR